MAIQATNESSIVVLYYQILYNYRQAITRAHTQSHGHWIGFHAIINSPNQPKQLYICSQYFPTARLIVTDIKDNSGHTAADVARGKEHRALADYVEEFRLGPRGKLHGHQLLYTVVSRYLHGHQLLYAVVSRYI